MATKCPGCNKELAYLEGHARICEQYRAYRQMILEDESIAKRIRERGLDRVASELGIRYETFKQWFSSKGEVRFGRRKHNREAHQVKPAVSRSDDIQVQLTNDQLIVMFHKLIHASDDAKALSDRLSAANAKIGVLEKQLAEAKAALERQIARVTGPVTVRVTREIMEQAKQGLN